MAISAATPYGAYLGSSDIAPPAELDTRSTALALDLIGRYGGTDGEHHKSWVLDQVVRLLHGAPVRWSERRWEGGQREVDFEVGTCAAYETWVRELRAGEDGPETYGYDEGIAP
jgi:hypothetical protein